MAEGDNTGDMTNDNNKTSKYLFLKENCIVTLLERLNKKVYDGYVERNNLILNVIRLKQPISKYELAKITNVSYNTIKQITKEFAFCGLIYESVSMGENSMPVKLLRTIKEREDEE